MLDHTPAVRNRFGVVAITGLVAALALVAAGCSGGGGNESSGGTTSTPKPAENADRGGKITVLSAGDVDFIDPGQAYYQYSYEIQYATQRPLLASKPDSVELSPDLAASMPKVSDDGRTV